VHAEELTRLAREAEAASERGELTRAATAWRRALELLPADAAQRVAVQARVAELSRRIEKGEGSTPAPGAGAEARPWSLRRLGGSLGAAAGVGLLAWKFKAILLLVLGKAKLLLFGLGKASTVLSMAASAGVYWAAFGWKFALGLVASIYVHEIGHVAALRRFGIPASAPMFVPGLGAFIRSKQYPATPREDARVGLAGPLWGLGATAAAWGLHLATGFESLAAIARVGAWINLFNLLPVATLDGGRGFGSLTRAQRWLAVAAIGAAWAATREGLLLLLLVAGALRAALGQPAREPDWTALGQYSALVALLSAATLIPVVAAR
jgi:Zn-dependent protease